MTKKNYLAQLNRALRPLRAGERKKSLQYFSELIDDKMEEGVPEELAVSRMEPVKSAALRILDEAKAQGQLRRRLTGWEKTLLVLGFPIWFPLLLTAFLVLAVIYLLVWLIIGCLFLLSISLGLAGLSGALGLFFFGLSSPVATFAFFGFGLAAAGLGIAVFVPLLYLSRAYARLTPVLWNTLIHGKGVY